MNKTNNMKVYKQIVLDADKKELVCETPDGVVTRRNIDSMTLEEAYKSVFGQEPQKSTFKSTNLERLKDNF